MDSFPLRLASLFSPTIFAIYRKPEKMHKSYVVAQHLREYAPTADKFPSKGLSPFAQAMPVECKREDPIEAYRVYYQTPDKQRIASWKRRERPLWYKIRETNGFP